MNTLIFSAESAVISDHMEQEREISAEKRAFFDAPVPRTDWGDMGASGHFVQLYDEDAHLLDAVSRFTGTGLDAGEAVVVIATQPHRDYLEAQLRVHGLDLATARAQGQYVPVDAAETLAQVMVDGCPDERRFFDVVGGIIARAGSWYPRVRGFGEMVALLWAEGNGDAALRLEALWNELAKVHTFSLFCAYPMSGFSRALHAEKFLKICAAHSHVIPSEGYTALTSPDERLRTIVALQQKANALEAEIAQRQELEQSLRRSEQELADFFNNGAMGLHWVGPDGIILRANEAELNLLGYAREEYVGHHIATFHADRHVIADILRRLHAGEELHDYEARLVCKDGTIKYVLIDSNVLWEQGQFIHTRCFTRDITAQKRAEAAEQQAYAELEHRVQERTASLRHEMAERQRLEREAQRVTHFTLLGRLAAGVSHEIRNPLGAIFLYVDLLEEELREPRPDSAGEVMAALAEIKTQLARLDDLVQDYLTLVRVASIQREVQDLGATVQVWGKEMEALAHPHGITVRMTGLEHLGPVAFHASTLRRAVLNLVQNALDAMTQGGTMTLTGSRTATHVQLEVRDTGCGMPTAQLAQIFEPLYTTKPGGTGLGLYIVQEIVAAHGGQITVQSAEGHGTTFTITLPWAADEVSGLDRSDDVETEGRP